MSAFHSPVLVDPRELSPGDQVGCTDAGQRLQVMVGQARGEHGVDELWLTVHNVPGETTHACGGAVPSGNVALEWRELPVGDPGRWTVAVLPQVWARRARG